MSNIEEDIYNVKELIQGSKLYGEYNGNKYFKSIENILAEREQDRKRIKELEEINTANRKVIVEQCDYIQNKSIPVQKVNDEIEKYEYMLAKTIHGEIQKYTPGEILLKIDTLKELLEEK